MSQFIGPEEILRKKKEYMIPCVYHFFQEPMQLVRGSMQHLYDQNGKEYLDCFAGVSVVNCGHCNPDITKEICKQVETLQHTCTIYLTEPIVNLAESLAQVTPGELQKTFFCSSGTEANEGAALLATLHTNHHEFIALRQGLHGRTKLTMSLTGIGMWRTDPSPVGGIHFAPNAYCYRCPLGKRHPECNLACADEIENVIKFSTSGQVAAFFAEPIQGNGGIITPPAGYFQRVKEILDHYGILLVMDEVQTGFGRTGKWFACEHYGINPDIMTMAKALGNGTPVGAFTATAAVADSYTRPGASTLGGNPVTATASLATLRYLKEHNLPERAAKLGTYLKKGLQELQQRHPAIGDVRGLGLMLGAEIILPDGSAASDWVDAILEDLKNKGFLVGKNGPGRNVLAFQPPLVIEESDLARLLEALDDSLGKICR